MSATLPNDAFWVEDGALMAGPYPGTADEDEARARLRAYLDAGVTTFIDLTDEAEGLEQYGDLLPELSPAARHLRFPILDADVPSHAWMRRIQSEIAQGVSDGELVYVHCWGGVGRTGTVVACRLIEAQGLSAEEAIARLAELRAGTSRAHRRAPETLEQEQFVRRFAQLRGAVAERRDLLQAWMAMRIHADVPGMADFTRRRYRALAAAFEIDPEAIVTEAERRPDADHRPDAAALLLATARAGQAVRSPFVGFEGADPELRELWIRWSKPIDKPLADLRSAFMHLLEESLELAVGDTGRRTVTAEDVRAHGFDPSEDPPAG